jgi:hypothetical protein
MGERTVTIDTRINVDDSPSTYTVATVLGTIYQVDDDGEAAATWYARPLLSNRSIGAYPNIERAIRALLEETLR